jgi:hypothetical protein
MPRPRLNAPAPQLSHGQAAYVLERLIADRRISPGEVSRYVSDMHREISDLETRLQTLRTHAGASAGTGSGTGSGGGTGSGATFGARRGRPPGRPPGRPSGSGVTASGKRRGRPPGSKNLAPSASASAAPSGTADAGSAPAAGKRRRRARITPEQLASRQLQGRYLGLIRQIPANKRGQYQKIAKDSGREAAINAMKSAVNR